jgi:uncharacterized protein with HEPN domain
VPPTLGDRISHIETQIRNIRKAVAGHTLASFRDDEFMVAAVERFLEKISEASRYIPEDMKATETAINWRRLADLGNWLRHAYHTTDAGLLWEMAKSDLEPLAKFVARIKGLNR